MPILIAMFAPLYSLDLCRNRLFYRLYDVIRRETEMLEQLLRRCRRAVVLGADDLTIEADGAPPRIAGAGLHRQAWRVAGALPASCAWLAQGIRPCRA